MTELSIIIPVYNREKTIEKCLDSIIESVEAAESFSPEIVLVDDGSADASVKICREYADKQNYIRLIENRHAGVSAARNAGIDAAKGEYIAFVDSDDYLGRDFISLLKDALKSKPELAVFRAHYFVNALGNCSEDAVDLTEGEALDIECIYAPLVEQKLNSCWSKAFRKDIISSNCIRFTEGMQISEDYLFVLDYASRCKSVSIYPFLPYYYCFAAAGFRRFTPELVYDLINAYSQTADFIFAKGINEFRQEVCQRYLQLLCEFLIRLYREKAIDDNLLNDVEYSALYNDILKTSFRKPKAILEKHIVTRKAFITGDAYLKMLYMLKDRIIK